MLYLYFILLCSKRLSYQHNRLKIAIVLELDFLFLLESILVSYLFLRNWALHVSVQIYVCDVYDILIL